MDLNGYLDLVSHDFKNETHEEILKAFSAFMPGRVFKGLPGLSFNIPMLRGRIWNQVGLPLLVQECSYPPFVTNYGRCNIPGHPVFYGSEILPVLLEEIEARIGDYIVISKWNFKVDEKIKIAPLIYGQNISNEIVKKFQRLMGNEINKLYPDEHEIANIFGVYLKTFNSILNANNYKLTGTLAHNMIYADKIFFSTFHCLMYSSIASYGNGTNYAIDKSLCDNQTVKPVSFYLCRFIETKPINEGYYVMTCHYYGKPDFSNKGISWEEFDFKKHSKLLYTDTNYKNYKSTN